MAGLKTFFSNIFFSKKKEETSIPLDNVIKKLIYILVVLMPLWFLPLAVNQVEINKQALLVLFVVITFILWLIKALSQGELEWKKGIFNILLGVFLIVAILSTIFSLRTYGSLLGWPTHLSGSLVNILSFLALFVLIINNFKGLKESFNLLFAFLVSSTVASVIGLIQLWGGHIFPWNFTKTISFNTIGSVNTLGIFSATLLILITALLFVVKKSRMKTFFLLVGLLNLLILLSVNFWVLWLVLAIGMAVILVFGLMRVVRLEESVGWVALPMAFLAISLIFMIFSPALPARPNLPTEVGLSQKASFQIAKESLTEKPILGDGPETFVFNYTKHKPETINQTAFWNVRFSNPTAEIYSIAIDMGILGLLSFLALIIFFAFKAISDLTKDDNEGNILKRFLDIGLFAAWLGLAVSWFVYPQNLMLMFTFWLLTAFYVANGNILKETKYNLKKSAKALLITSFAFVVMIIVIVGILYTEGSRYIAEAKYSQGINLIQRDGELEEGIEKVINSTVLNPYEDRTYRVLSQLFILKMNNDSQKENLTPQERSSLVQVDIANAINSINRATTLSPKDVSNWLIRGQVYRQVMGLVDGAGDWSVRAFQTASDLEPKNPFIYIEWGRTKIAQANRLTGQTKPDEETRQKIEDLLDEALKKFEKAVELKPDYSPAHFEIARIYDARGELGEAIIAMETNRRILPRDTGLAFQLGVLYYKAEEYQKAKSEFIRAVALDPDYSNARYFLGLLYDREGDKESALDQFRRIAQLNPDNEHVKDIIENLEAGRPALGSPDLGPPEEPSDIPIETTPEEDQQ
ncbi:MAG: tetratricopeptide repeat protein [Candidatus Portnoybacteria bacterium]|nr:tetratricopeptide repeat protein [Candidatus Portnoybacteria bacterium]